jgi:soluble lytic murein transglycosylase-like protein
MDIFADISAVQTRIAEITGSSAAGDETAGPAFGRALSSALGKNAPPAYAAGAASGVIPGTAPAVPAQIDALVSQNSAAWQVDPSLVKAVIVNESGFDAKATSRTGAQGLMQLMPSTAAAVGVRDAYDPVQNVAGGTRYLKSLLDRFGGDVRRAVGAYNAGPEAVEKYGDVPPYAETQNYVQNVLGSYAKYRTPQ